MNSIWTTMLVHSRRLLRIDLCLAHGNSRQTKCEQLEVSVIELAPAGNCYGPQSIINITSAASEEWLISLHFPSYSSYPGRPLTSSRNDAASACHACHPSSRVKRATEEKPSH